VVWGGIEKMSKSKNNGVDPQQLIDQYGADTARLFVMFAAPPEQSLEWSSAGVEGAHRFLRRLHTYATAQTTDISQAGAVGNTDLPDNAKAVRREIHLVLQQANFDYERAQYNTVVSAGMKMLNALESAKLGSASGEAAVKKEGLSILLRVLYPVVPHLTWTLWNELGYAKTSGDLLDAAWPQPEAAALEQTELELVVQVNGKLRASIRVPKDADKAFTEATALANENVQKFIPETGVKKVIVVAGKLVNIVV
jgi:leucyl-tRNA synthetase